MIFEDANGIPTVQLGDGDVVMGVALVDGYKETERLAIAFVPADAPNEVGAECPEVIGRKITSYECAIAIQFKNPKAIEVLIEQLQGLKEVMEGKAGEISNG